MKLAQRFGFYAILTDPLRGYEYCTNILVAAGIPFVQLRIKDRPPKYICSIAEKMRKITDGSTTRFIINDDAYIARQCAADGVHIGQDDMEYHEARAIMGPDAIIGISTHNPLQTTSATVLSPDYIGIGPVFTTPTKKNPDPTIGIEGMKKMLQQTTVPAVAIGGIDIENLNRVLEAGAENFCMVRQFVQSAEPEKTLQEIIRIYRSYFPQG